MNICVVEMQEDGRYLARWGGPDKRGWGFFIRFALLFQLKRGGGDCFIFYDPPEE